MHVPRALTLIGAVLVAATAVATTSASTANTIFTAAGNGSQGFGGDGGQAVAATLSLPTGLALTHDSGVVIADSGNSRIRNVSAGDVITTIAGTGTIGFSGDGGPAKAAQISAAGGLAVLADGAVVIADTGNDRIRVVSTGVITTIAGGGPPRVDLGDRLPATAATLEAPAGVAATPDGGFLIADSGNNRIRKVSPAGIITTVAGVGTAGFSGDGGSALAAQLDDPLGVTPAPGGGFYIADTLNDRIRFVAADGTITTAVGGGSRLGDRGVPTAARLSHPSSVTLTEDGYLIADQTGNRIRYVSNVAAKLSVSIIAPSRCVRSAFTTMVRTGSTYLVTSVTLRLDGRRLAARDNAVLAVRIKAAALKKGRHVLRADAVDSTGLKASVTRRFTRCRA
jgi:trimeric autotransporter adhesin